MPFWKTFLKLKLMFNAKLSDYHLSLLQHSDTCNKVESCIEHGRPDQSQRELTAALIT